MNNTRDLFESFPVKDWYDLMLRKEKYSYFIDRPIEVLVKSTKGEIDELLRGIEAGDVENIKEEVADVIFNTCQLLQACLKRGLISKEDVTQTGKQQKSKIYKRQPYLKTQNKLDSREEETALFKKLKNKC